jgi:hypothetical protein
MITGGYALLWLCILIDVHTILQGQGRCFPEELYSDLVPTIKNIFSNIEWLTNLDNDQDM